MLAPYPSPLALGRDLTTSSECIQYGCPHMLSRTSRVLQALGRESRKNPRLRDVIEALSEQVAELRQDLDLHSYRMAQMQADLDQLKMKTPKAVKTKKRSRSRRARKPK